MACWTVFAASTAWHLLSSEQQFFSVLEPDPDRTFPHHYVWSDYFKIQVPYQLISQIFQQGQ